MIVWHSPVIIVAAECFVSEDVTKAEIRSVRPAIRLEQRILTPTVIARK